MRDLIDIIDAAKNPKKPVMESGEGAAILSEAEMAFVKEGLTKYGLLKEGRVDKKEALEALKWGAFGIAGYAGLKTVFNALGIDVPLISGGSDGYYGPVGGGASSHPFDGTYSGTDRMGIDIPYREDGQQGIADGTRGDSHGNYAHNGIDPYDR